MDKKKVDNAAEVKKDEALKESFAEIKKAAAVDKLDQTETVKAKEEAPKKRGRKTTAAKTVKTEAKAEKAEVKVEKAEKPAVKKTAVKKASEPKTSVTLEFNGKQFNVDDVLKQALKAAKKAKKDAKEVSVYVVANQSAAYYVIDGEGKDEYRINL